MTVDPTAATAAEPGREARGPASGDSLGKYRLERVLGAGGMGIVWAAFDPDLERAVAIKVLRAADSDEVLRSRLLREARAMARLKHPNVLTVYEVGTVQNRDYIAMELVDGDNLDTWLGTRPPREQVIDALFAAGRGLAAAHAAGLVHRDFKPQNILRSRDGHVYVTDFGLARGQIEDGAEVEQVAVAALPDELATSSQYPRRALDSILDSPLTQTGVLIGTPAYMAPEQFAGRPPDARTDQFAFCVTAWEGLTGARPFRGATLGELEAAVGSGVPAGAEPASGPPGSPTQLPPRAREVLVRGLDPSPAARWPDLPALLGALGQALAPEPVAPAASGAGRAWLIAGGLGAVAAIAIAAVMLFDVGGVRSAAAGDCDSPEDAFDSAWSADRRAALLERQPKGDLVAATSVLDGVRHAWIDELRRTCREKPSQARTDHLTCLRGARDALSKMISKIESGGAHLDMATVLPVATSFGMCEVSHQRAAFPGSEDDEGSAQDAERAAEAAERAADRAREHAERAADRVRDKLRDEEGDEAIDVEPPDEPEPPDPGGATKPGPGARPGAGLGLTTGDPDLDRYIRRQIRKHLPPVRPRAGHAPATPEVPAPPEPAAPTEPESN